MTYEEFVELVKADHEVVSFDKIHGLSKWVIKRLGLVDSSEEYCYYSWCTGGMGGGSCWGDSPERFAGSEEPQSAEGGNVFIALMESYAPDISFLKFRRLQSELIHDGEYSEIEYYGNFSDFHVKFFSLKDLYNAIFNE